MSSSPIFKISFLSIFSCLALLLLPFVAQAIVPLNETFTHINHIDRVGELDNEYGADYRVIDIFEDPFQLIFYNTTPNAYTLAIRMGVRRSRSVLRWVWEANRGNPVRDNATFSFGQDGNLVLSDADGRIAWQTNTANKGVVKFKLLSNGNMVLLDKNNNFIWQSFDSPTDTLLLGQPLRARGPKTLISRASEKVNVNGAFSMVLEKKGVRLYYKTKNSPKPYRYYAYDNLIFVSRGAIDFVNLTTLSETFRSYGFDLVFEYSVVNATGSSPIPLDSFLGRLRYNATLTYLRLGIDGNVKLHTYLFPERNAISDIDDNLFDAFEVTYALFKKGTGESECHLPDRCGNFGVCEDSQCVACPSPMGLLGWTKDCEAPKLTSCAENSFKYYKIVGVDHFSSKYKKGDGPMQEGECMKKCSNNCKCLGYFYHQTTSSCWAVNDLKTLSKVANSTNVGYIKTPI